MDMDILNSYSIYGRRNRQLRRNSMLVSSSLMYMDQMNISRAAWPALSSILLIRLMKQVRWDCLNHIKKDTKMVDSLEILYM